MEKIKSIQPGDLLTFKAADNRYKILLCTSAYKERSPYNYVFSALTYDHSEKPTIDQACDTEFFGIGNRRGTFFKYSDEELEKMWMLHPEVRTYCLGSYGLIIWRKDFMKFRDNFEVIGNIKIVANLDKHGNGGVNASSWDYIKNFFSQDFSMILQERGQKKFKVKAILKS